MSSKASKASAKQTIFWWVVWITLTIVSFFLSAAFWTPIIAKHFGTVRETRTSIYWVISVFGTWMVILVPLIIVMYSKVDRAYEDARIRREKNAARFRSIFVEPSKRLIPQNVAAKISAWPQTIEGGHLVNAHLKNGTTVPNVFIAGQKEILGVYNATELTFEGNDVADVEPVDFKKTPAFLANFWLRLDGVKPEE